MIASLVRPGVGFEIRSVRIGFEMDTLTHGQNLFTSTIIFPFQRRSTKGRRRFVCHRRHINLVIDGVFEKKALPKTRSKTMIYDPVNSKALARINL